MLNLIENDKWIDNFKELWYDLNVLQETAEDIRGDSDVNSIIFEELEGALSSMKNRKVWIG